MMKRVFGVKNDKGKEKEKELPPSVHGASNWSTERGETADEKIKKLDAVLSRYREQIKRTRPGPAQEVIKARVMRVLKQKRTYEGQRDMLCNQTSCLDQVAFAAEEFKGAQQNLVAKKMTHVSRDNDGTVGGNQCPALLNPSGEGGVSTSPDSNDQSLLPNCDGGMEGGPLGSAQDGVEPELWIACGSDGEWTCFTDYNGVGGNQQLPSAHQGGIMSNDPNDQYVQSSEAGEELDQASLSHGEVGGQKDEGKKKSSSWTELEHKIFLVAMTVYGRGKWKQIPKEVLPGKTPSQMASHCQKYFERGRRTDDEKKRRSVHDIGYEHLTDEDMSHMEKLFKRRLPPRSQLRLGPPHPMMPGQPQERLDVSQIPAVLPSSYQSGTAGHPHGHLQAPAMHTMPARHEPVNATSYVHTNLAPPYCWNTAPSLTLDTHAQNPENRSNIGMRTAAYYPAEVQLPAASIPPIPAPTLPPGLQEVEPFYQANYFVQLLNGEYPLTPQHMSFLNSLGWFYRD